MTSQSWDPEGYQRNAGFVSALGEPLIGLLQPAVGERVLDLGCGDGTLTLKLAASGIDVVGVDSSPAQIAAATARGLEAYVMDARQIRFQGEFDAVFSNAALHWVREPELVAERVFAALRPGGRFVGEMGGKGNIATICRGLQAALARRGLDGEALFPWYFPDVEKYSAVLTGAGFRVAHAELFERPTPLPTDMTGWLETMAGPFLAGVGEAERPAFLAEVVEDLAPDLRDADGRWTADYVRLRFAAIRP